MNIVCLNCESVTQTADRRKKFCGPVCRNRFNVRKSRSKPKKKGIDLRALIRGIEEKNVVRVSAQAQTYQKEEWRDPI